MADAQIRAVITAKDDASSVVNNFSKSLQGADKSSQSAGSSFLSTAASIASGIGIFNLASDAISSITDAIGDSITKAEDYQNAEEGLQNAFQNNVTLTDKSTTSLIAQANALSDVTAFTDEQYVAADDMLAIHKLNQEQISTLVPRIADMAQGLANATGETADLTGATSLVAKALGEGDSSGLTASLKRAGIALSDHQTAVLQTGTMEEKVTTITDLLSSHFAGLSTADTASIKIGILNNQLDNTEQAIGLALLPTIATLASKLATFVESDRFQAWLKTATDWLQVNLPKALSWIIDTGIPEMKRLFDEWAPRIENVVSAISHLIDKISTAWGWIQKFNTVSGWLNPLTQLPTALHALHVPGFATGVTNFGGGMALVGEAGPELVTLPKGSNVTPNSQLPQGSAQPIINIIVQSVYSAGTEIEKRKFALDIFGALQDVAASKNTSVAAMLS